MEYKILVIEDSREYQIMLESSLNDTYQIVLAENGAEAIKKISEMSFDLFLVDIVLPDMSGLQICSFIKSQKELENRPVILLTSKDTTDDKVKGLDSGADDYITKPFDFEELHARIRAQLRKVSPLSQEAVIPNLDINTEKQSVVNLLTNENIDLTRIEFKLLVCFSQRIDHILSRQQILDIVWPNDLSVSERTVDSHISNLRKKLQKTSIELTAVHGSGYRFSLLKEAA